MSNPHKTDFPPSGYVHTDVNAIEHQHDHESEHVRSSHAEGRSYQFILSKPDPRDVKIKFTDDHVSAYRTLNKLSPTIPTSFDIRTTVKLPQALSDIDQGNLGSCTANAISYAYAVDEFKQGNHEIFLPSRLFIYYNERLIEGTVNQDAGAQIRDGIKSINTYGVCDEHHWIYDPTKFTEKPPASVYTEAKSAKSVRYAAIDFSSDRTIADRTAHIKRTLLSGFPVVFGFTVFPSFETATVAKTGVVPMPRKTERSIGGHAVVAVGYDDAHQRFIVKNSWGSNWGLDGYFYMPYSYLADPNLADDFWVIQQVTDPNNIPNFKPTDINPDAINLNADVSGGGVVHTSKTSCVIL